ncbi:MAG: two-component system sensor histidine kinase NtrB [Longimicrobiales bacterium]
MAQTLRLLRWLYVGRLTVAGGIFAGALGAWSSASSATTLIATLALLLALGVTLASVWYTHVMKRRPTRSFLYGQVAFDALLVTAIVHITTVGAQPSDFSSLYVLVIAAAALLLPLPGGMLVGALACVLYIADTLWLQPGFAVTPGAIGQIVLFGVIALVTAALGDRLRRSWARLGRAESELRQLRLDTNDILATIDTGLVTVDGGGRLMHCNAAAESVLGLRARDWSGRPVLEELDRCVPGLGSVIARTAETRVAVRRHELRMHGVEGERFLGMRTTVLERRGEPWVTAVVQDVTEFKQIDELIRRAERLQAVAELGASLAHEIKNPLASIRSSVEQLAADRLSPNDRTVLRRLVLSESDRLTRLLSEFMEFSRLELRRWQKIDLREIAGDALSLVRQHPDAGCAARIDFTLPAEPVVVDGDQDLLHRALFNLLLNAVQHAGATGLVRLEIGRVADFDVPKTVPLDAPVRITVHDSGPGIAAEDIPNLFNPFYTTRDGGNGLGLAMVHRAVEAHRGAILVDGNPGTGAKFTVYLPAHNGRRR